MTTTSPTRSTGQSVRLGVQKFGTFLSGMIMPNIAAFIAWGLLTALFIPTGYLPNADIAQLINPILFFMLPLLIANTGGRMVYDTRGGVVATIATMGVIVGTIGEPYYDGGSPMFLGAMITGPLAAYLLKVIERLWIDRIRPGFEMLVNNFSAGILGAIFAIGAFFALTPVIGWITARLGGGVGFLVDNGLLPLTSIVIEPAKVLFLNNAINQGILTPLGTTEALQNGKSILFLLEANPGPGLGVLLAFAIFGAGAARSTAPGAILIQFVGGIHEIYFPYVLSKPLLFLAVIAGGASGVATNVAFGSGLRAPASPGSIIAVLGQTASDSFPGVILSVIISAAVTFVVAAVILRTGKKGSGDFGAAVAATQANKGKESSVLSGLGAETGTAGTVGGLADGQAATSTGTDGGTATATRIQDIVFACDAGMGSSAMGASVLRNKMKKAGLTDVTVVNKAIAALDGQADLVITQRELTDRAREKSPASEHVSVDNFMNSPRYDEIVELVRKQRSDS
ncbi:PTS mannitol transporter subunit IICB [Clavibacter michiganensis]|uniref:PTS mannitol transporter subunit IICB n=1 Tax=Clavibacter michiganensis TaxID=28447 RepID=UPI001BE0C580|nr:PTS mannitol transporter subunit IICB [Clavibacter michiganensis]MBT1634820.1 PTS mannitol transporter subunit IICB [Clavibacter michiganensis]